MACQWRPNTGGATIVKNIVSGHAAPVSKVGGGIFTHRIGQPSSILAAKAQAIRVLDLVGRTAGADLRVHNLLHREAPVANALLAARLDAHAAAFHVQDTVAIDGAETIVTDASGDQTITDSSDGTNEVVDVQDTVATTDASGDTITDATDSVPQDTVDGSTGTLVIQDEKNGAMSKGDIVYSPDARAVQEGEGDETISFDASGDEASVSIDLVPDAVAADPGATASLADSENLSSGDVTASGSLSTADGVEMHILAVFHPDGTTDLTCIGPSFSILLSRR